MLLSQFADLHNFLIINGLDLRPDMFPLFLTRGFLEFIVQQQEQLDVVLQGLVQFLVCVVQLGILLAAVFIFLVIVDYFGGNGSRFSRWNVWGNGWWWCVFCCGMICVI